MSFSTPPPSSPFYLSSFPAPGVLLATINRPKHMNSVSFQGHWDFEKLWNWFENEGSLSAAIITGAGDKAFCAGQDLIEAGNNRLNPPSEPYLTGHPRSGFAGLSKRKGKKPIIAAVNGYAFGGGFEICLNWYVYLAILFSDQGCEPCSNILSHKSVIWLWLLHGHNLRSRKRNGVYMQEPEDWPVLCALLGCKSALKLH